MKKVRKTNLPLIRKALQQLRSLWYAASAENPFYFTDSLSLLAGEESGDSPTVDDFCIDFIWSKNVKKSNPCS